VEGNVDQGQEKGGTWTPLKVLQWAVPFLRTKGLPNPKLDSELLLAHALGIDRLKVYLQFDRPLDRAELDLIRGYFIRRAGQEPIQYITGTREFFGYPFQVGPGVLIPRPETEHLVEKAISFLGAIPEREPRVLDLGTGSGCIALSLAKKVSCRVWAVEKSEKALKVAIQNGIFLGVGTIHWRLGDWYGALQRTDPAQFHLLVSNPPYVSHEEKEMLDPEVLEFEPSEALFAEESGMGAYRKIAEKAWEKLIPGGNLILETHPDRWEEVSALFPEGAWRQRELIRDLSGHPRVLALKRQYRVDIENGRSI
jgi:release factor glutamine methyltransferase